MADLLDRVRRYAGRHRLFDRGETVVVGVSGGPDSLCLLHLLCRLAPELDLALHVAHLNHGLRGAESDADAAYVAALAARWRLPCTVERADLGSLGRVGAGSAPHRSLEEAARQARYRFLAEVAGQVGSATVAVGHNADDQAETVLMHFLRGSGVAGLRGMLPRTDLADYRLGITPRPPLRLVRPLLSTPRAEILAYCAGHGLEPRFDRSNEDRTIYRNRLRHELLPLLETYNPAIRAVLTRTAEVMAGDYEVLAAGLDAAWERVALGSARGQPEDLPDEVQFDLAGWRALPIGLQRATLREAVRRLRRGLRNINWEHVERAVWLAREGSTGQAATLAAGLALEIGYDRLRIAAETAPWPDAGGVALPCPGPPPQVEGEIVLRAPGVTALAGGWQVVVRRLQRDALPPEHPLARRGGGQGPTQEDPWLAWLDADVVGEHLVLRPRRPGDRFQPQGLGGRTAGLHEFMINRKVPRDARAGWPLLFGRAGLAWACGLRLDERAIVRPDTVAIWEVRFVRAAGEENPMQTGPVSR